jgi:lipoyl(octanoyl) transferase
MPDIEWMISDEVVPYQDAVDFMENRVAQIYDGSAKQLVWLLEHPPIYTLGTSASENDVIGNNEIEVIKSGRGGQVTYHGPGQRVIYLMLDLRKHGQDVRKFVCNVEKWIIATLNQLGIKGAIRDGRVGVWVDTPLSDGSIREEKIAAIGLRIRKWVSFHGASINLNPDLSHFGGIIPCGLSPDEFGVTSINKIKPEINMAQLDEKLRHEFAKFFN